MNRRRQQFSMRNTIAAQFIRHDLPRAFTMRSQQPPEESFRGLSVSAWLQVYVNDITVLIHSSPQVETFTLDADEHLVDEKRVVESGVFALESLRKQRT